MPAPGVNGVAAGFPPSRNPLLPSPAEAGFAKAGRRAKQGREKIRREKMLGGTRMRSVRIGPALLRVPPFPPMGRPHVQPFLGLYFHPAVENAAAREHKRMRAVIIDDGQFKVAVERRGGYLLPHLISVGAESTGALT